MFFRCCGHPDRCKGALQRGDRVAFFSARICELAVLSRRRVAWQRAILPVAVVLLLLCAAGRKAAPVAAHSGEQDWPAYGGGPEDIRYSDLKQINRSNVSRLEVAWTYDAADGPGDPQTQPIMVSG